MIKRLPFETMKYLLDLYNNLARKGYTKKIKICYNNIAIKGRKDPKDVRSHKSVAQTNIFCKILKRMTRDWFGTWRRKK